jgi:hypothetical protein
MVKWVAFMHRTRWQVGGKWSIQVQSMLLDKMHNGEREHWFT